MASEKRLIDKDELIELCDAPHWCVWMSEIEDFPTVDAVEVVRCKDCRHYSSYGYLEDNPEKMFYRCCFGIFNNQRHDKESEYFCYKGERRNDV